MMEWWSRGVQPPRQVPGGERRSRGGQARVPARRVDALARAITDYCMRGERRVSHVRCAEERVHPRARGVCGMRGGAGR